MTALSPNWTLLLGEASSAMGGIRPFAASAMRWCQDSESGRSEWPETEHLAARPHGNSESNSDIA
ncbi:hypothetical protein [Ruegeria arenilitoris]|uniref:hypothetical protein n=1 Tax=Ruegeria arenilitoris TaxID=1173585 RepID=UPI0020C204BA|nr:hypothetical protein [Ruegeria arenilitoris]